MVVRDPLSRFGRAVLRHGLWFFGCEGSILIHEEDVYHHVLNRIDWSDLDPPPTTRHVVTMIHQAKACAGVVFSVVATAQVVPGTETGVAA